MSGLTQQYLMLATNQELLDEFLKRARRTTNLNTCQPETIDELISVLINYEMEEFTG